MSWCNEFLLMSNHKETNRSLYLYNLITKNGFNLPECNALSGEFFYSHYGAGLCFDGFKGVYKVVHLFMLPTIETIECQILILGRDGNHISTKWKQCLFPYKEEDWENYWGDPVSVQGSYINRLIHGSNNFVSVDMVKEKICVKSLPKSHDRGEFVCSLFVMGGFLALFDGVSNDKAEIWILKDFQRERWEKLQTITGRNKYFDDDPDRYFQICGMVGKRYIILKSMLDMYSYDLKSGVMKELDVDGLYTQLIKCDDDDDDAYCVFHLSAPSLK